MKKVIALIFVLTLVLVLAGCQNKQTVAEKYGFSDASITKVQFVEAEGNPAYGADTKNIDDTEEVAEFAAAFKNAYIGNRVKDGDIYIGAVSRCFLYQDDTLVAELWFNVNETDRIWIDGYCYYVKYKKTPTPWELYKKSKAETFVVDWELNEMVRPTD